MKNTIYPCLWFDNQAAEAAQFYCSIIKNSTITVNTPMVVNFELDGNLFMGLNGGPIFTINPSISFFIRCDSVDEATEYWGKLIEGGTVLMALDKYDWSEKYGWLQDKFGVSWQIFFGQKDNVSQKIWPSLMFTARQCGRTEEAIGFYTSVFDNSNIDGIQKYTLNDNDKEGLVKHAQFGIENYHMMAFDSSAPHAFAFNEAISFVVPCDTQEEIDYYWSKLTDGGKESQCGWLKDKFDVSWQIVPTILGQLMTDPQRSARVMQAFMKMKKFDIEKLLNA